MSVTLVWATPDADRLIADMARVSSPQNVGNDAARLIGYLIRHKHWSPFELVNACMEIHAPRDIGRQILRHSSLRPAEFSQRYADVRVLGQPYVREARMQDPKNRQNSLPCPDADLVSWWEEEQMAVWDRAARAYSNAIARGLAKEVARIVLPEGMTPSKMYFNGNIRSWFHYCALRRGNGTQAEHRAIATAAWDVLRTVAPACVAAFEQAEGTPA